MNERARLHSRQMKTNLFELNSQEPALKAWKAHKGGSRSRQGQGWASGQIQS